MVGLGVISVDLKVLVVAWKGAASFVKLLQAGFHVLQATHEYFYLDCGMGGWVRQPSILGLHKSDVGLRSTVYHPGANTIHGAGSTLSMWMQTLRRRKDIF